MTAMDPNSKGKKEKEGGKGGELSSVAGCPSNTTARPLLAVTYLLTHSRQLAYRPSSLHPLSPSLPVQL